ncbi:hypothetical protein NDU88_003832 [Pleurodeles waltl]|uniref:Uncharacterized protein n=1 Tax=Pleurodeles waltl TaxID=8319 RepID=A0AAV7QAI4_PLEWA|nr:hypothetical protein NDU88_003832 [Pleurodeles waltl]
MRRAFEGACKAIASRSRLLENLDRSEGCNLIPALLPSPLGRPSRSFASGQHETHCQERKIGDTLTTGAVIQAADRTHREIIILERNMQALEIEIAHHKVPYECLRHKRKLYDKADQLLRQHDYCYYLTRLHAEGDRSGRLLA